MEFAIRMALGLERCLWQFPLKYIQIWLYYKPLKIRQGEILAPLKSNGSVNHETYVVCSTGSCFHQHIGWTVKEAKGGQKRKVMLLSYSRPSIAGFYS